MSSHDKRRQVFLCDDDDSDPFWKRGDKARAGFSYKDWVNWKIEKIANPRGDQDLVGRFRAEIERKALSDRYYIVTDAHFGRNSKGGSKLLVAVQESLVRGVVFSRDPALCEGGELLVQAGRAEMVVDDKSKASTDKVRGFIETGEASEPIGNRRDRNLSRAIHRLENLVLPIQLDIETLSERGQEQLLVLAIWQDYFGTAKNGGGFLHPHNEFGNEVKGIENEIVEILASTCLEPNSLGAGILSKINRDGNFDADLIAKDLGITQCRDKSDSVKNDPGKLKENLRQVVSKIEDLTSAIRNLR